MEEHLDSYNQPNEPFFIKKNVKWIPCLFGLQALPIERAMFNLWGHNSNLPKNHAQGCVAESV